MSSFYICEYLFQHFNNFKYIYIIRNLIIISSKYNIISIIKFIKYNLI